LRLIKTGVVRIWTFCVAHTPATADYEQVGAVSRARPRLAVVAACGPSWDSGPLPDGILQPIGFLQPWLLPPDWHDRMAAGQVPRKGR
jgi:hypothetical protein